MNSNLNQISDGRLYRDNDMVRIGSHDCEGCAECCTGMGQSILVDPYDVYLLSQNLNTDFATLVNEGKLELALHEGLMLPNLKMRLISLENGGLQGCGFLSNQGRCTIHGFRPGICRLFPLGRNYEDNSLKYFVLRDACSAENLEKVKISKWLGYPNIKEYQQYLVEWHSLVKQVRGIVEQADDEKFATSVMTGFVNLFFMQPYSDEKFFEEFYERQESLFG